VLCAYEEAIGYMACDLIRDKDGITMGALIVELASWLANQGRTLTSYIESGYQRSVPWAAVLLAASL